MDVFRFFRPFGERREDRPERRRAQVRRAQQTYRLRKDQYTKSLENEVARLQAIEANLVQETQYLYSIIRTLGNLLADCGIHVDLPTGPASEGKERQPDTGLPGRRTQSTRCYAGERAQLNVSPASRTGVAAAVIAPETVVTPNPEAPPPRSTHSFRPEVLQGSCSTGWQDNSPTFPDHSVPTTEHHVPPIPATSRPGSVRLGDLDPTTVGMEFVLALEEPCLGHIHGDLNNPHQPSGHALTISSRLLSLSPQSQSPSPPSPPDANTLSEACGKASASILDRLLTLSTNLTLEDEITPVQAWNHIRRQPLFGQLRVDRLLSLTKKLGDAVKCHGFGAVFKEDVFEKLVHEALAEGPMF